MPGKRVNVGGTSGGLGEFLGGLVLMLIGLYMIFTNTVIATSFWDFHGYNLLGPLILLFMVGLVFLFINGSSGVGWLLCSGALLAIIIGIVMNLRFYFKSITLLSGLIMFGLPAVGLGMIFRSLQAHNAVTDEE